MREGRVPSKCKQMLNQYSACVKSFEIAQEKNAVKIGNGEGVRGVGGGRPGSCVLLCANFLRSLPPEVGNVYVLSAHQLALQWPTPL